MNETKSFSLLIQGPNLGKVESMQRVLTLLHRVKGVLLVVVGDRQALLDIDLEGLAHFLLDMLEQNLHGLLGCHIVDVIDPDYE